MLRDSIHTTETNNVSIRATIRDGPLKISRMLCGYVPGSQIITQIVRNDAPPSLRETGWNLTIPSALDLYMILNIPPQQEVRDRLEQRIGPGLVAQQHQLPRLWARSLLPSDVFK